MAEYEETIEAMTKLLMSLAHSLTADERLPKQQHKRASRMDANAYPSNNQTLDKSRSKTTKVRSVVK